MARDNPYATARQPQCAVKWDQNLKAKLAIMRQYTSVTDSSVGTGQKPTKLISGTAWLSPLLISPSAFQYWVAFLNGSTMNQGVYVDFRPTQIHRYPNDLCHLWSYYTRIIYTVNAHIDVAISHCISKYQSNKWREFVGIPQNLLPWQHPLRYWKKRSRSITCTHNAFIQWKRCENWTSRSWDNCSPSNHVKKDKLEMHGKA